MLIGLEYAPADHRRRRVALQVIFGVLLAAGAIWAIRAWGTSLLRRWDDYGTYRRFQDQCLTHIAPSDEVAFDETTLREPVGLLESASAPPSKWRVNRQDPVLTSDAAKALHNVAGTWGSRPVGWTQLERAEEQMHQRVRCEYGLRPIVIYDPEGGSAYTSAMAGGARPSHHERVRFFCFLHGRRSAGGNQKLVAIAFDGGAFIWNDPKPFWARIMDVGVFGNGAESKWNRVTTFDFKPDASGSLRLYAGQPDPADESHFTIGFDVGGAKGIIDGWLKDDDTISLQIREAGK